MLSRKKLLHCLFVYAGLLVLVSCKNPFETGLSDDESLPSEDFQNNTSFVKIIQDSEDKEEQEKTPAVQYSSIFLDLNLDSRDLEIQKIAEDFKVTLFVSDEYESYSWMMADELIAVTNCCVIDFSGFGKNLYPIVIYAVRDSRVYSGMVNVYFNGESISFDIPSRTVLPILNVLDFSNITVEVINLENGSIDLISFFEYSELSGKHLKVLPGNYKINVTANIKTGLFSGCYENEFSAGINRISVNMMQQNSVTDGIGSFELKAKVLCDSYPDNVLVKFYKKECLGFSIYKELELVKGNLHLLNADKNVYEISLKNTEMIAGEYWFRVDINYKNKAAHYVDFIYIEPELSSAKEITISQYYDMYSIEYNFNGGFYIGNKLINKFSSFDTIILPSEENLIKPGYTFSGWYYDKELTKKASEKLQYGEIQKNIVLNASWSYSDLPVPYGVGLLPDNSMEIEVKENKITVKLEPKENIELWILDLCDSYDESFGIKIERIMVNDGIMKIDGVLPELAEDVYTLKLYGYNSNELVEYENQLIKLCSN